MQRAAKLTCSRARGSVLAAISPPRIATFPTCALPRPYAHPDVVTADELRIATSQSASTVPVEYACLGAGCFWCVETRFRSVVGVLDVRTGYAGGNDTSPPTYETVSSGRTGHAETILIAFDPRVVSYSQLLAVFASSFNLRCVNGQGKDKGTQYRSIILYVSDMQRNAAIHMMRDQEKAPSKPSLPILAIFLPPHEPPRLATQLVPLSKFWVAEDIHQQYEARIGDEESAEESMRAMLFAEDIDPLPF